jgi:hypothetical protein
MNRNREKLSDEDLQEKMNFDKFMSEYQPVSFYKTWKFYATVGLAGLMVLGTFLLYTDSGEQAGSTETKKVELFVNPPLQGVNVNYTIYKLKAGTDTILEYPSGSRLHVPANAFLDARGQAVKGQVELRYREFHDAADFFVSGIPMTYDSAGIQYQFESAGMLDILVNKDGEPLFVNRNEQILIDMASDVKGNRFNIYYLDTISKRWDYMKEDVVMSAESEPMKAGKQIPLSVLLKDSLIAAPEKASPDCQRFDIAFDKKLYPELAAYDGVSFQVARDEKRYDPKLAMSDWDNVKIERCPDGVHYLITFSNRSESHVFKVQPVFAGADYVNAKRLYDSKLKSYEQSRAFQATQSAGRKRKLDSTYRSQYVKMKSANDQSTASMKFNSAIGATENRVRREFEISRFGIWNSDCPSSLPVGKKVFAKFLDEKKAKYDFNHVYLVERGKKAMFTYYPEAYKMFTYNPASFNILWAVTKENKLATFPAEEFARIKLDKDTSVFKMQVSEIRVTSVGDVRKLLGI